MMEGKMIFDSVFLSPSFYPSYFEDLQKMIAGGRIMSRLDQNGNRKFDSNKFEMLNSRLAQGIQRRRPRESASPSFRRPPEKKPAESSPVEAPKPEEKKEEKPARPARSDLRV
jgi:hypothetical protein